jgi:hypothetical protein
MNRHSNSRSLALVTLCLLMISTFACEKQVEINSRWCGQEIDFDGPDEQWGPATIYAEKQKVSLTVFNDDGFIYLRVYTRDRGVQGPVLMSGFTVWFNPDGSKNKTTGIRFPIGMQGRGAPIMSRDRQGAQAMERITEEMNEMEILGPDQEPVRRMFLAEAASFGIDVRIDMVKANLVYELKFPLVNKDGYPYAVGMEAEDFTTSKVIGIGFETQKIDRDEVRKTMNGEGPTGSAPPQPGGMPSGGAPPEGGGMPPGGGERPGGGAGMPSGSMPEQLKLWTKVTLSSAP